MPVIKTRKKILQPPIKYKEHEQSKYYNSHIWQRLRSYYYSRHPLCECCLAHDRYTPAEHVHHRRMFMSGKDDNERWRLLSDQNNLTSLCIVCHEADCCMCSVRSTVGRLDSDRRIDDDGQLRQDCGRHRRRVGSHRFARTLADAR